MGTGKTLTPASLVVSDGNSGANYSYTYATATTGTISKTGLTVTAAACTKTYDGTTSATGTPTITAGAIQTGDTAPAWTETYDTRNAGTGKTLTPAGVVSDGNSGANYAYTYGTVTTGVINKTNLTVTAATCTKTYDGTTSATGAPTITTGHIQTGDTAPAWTETYDTRNVGTGKTLTPAGVVSDGNSGANYAYTYGTVTTGVISQTNITATAAANSKTYDGTTSATGTPTITSGHIQTGDTAAFTETYDTANVGTGKTLTPAGTVTDGNGGANYNYSFVTAQNGTITIATTTNILTSSLNPSSLGSNVTFTATVTNTVPGGPTPTGNVQFKTNGVALGAAVALNGSGVATLVTNCLPQGSNTVSAEYAGNSNFRGSTNSLVQVVTGSGTTGLGKGDWIWEMPQTMTSIGVTNTQGVISNEVYLGMKWITVKCGDGTDTRSPVHLQPGGPGARRRPPDFRLGLLLRLQLDLGCRRGQRRHQRPGPRRRRLHCRHGNRIRNQREQCRPVHAVLQGHSGGLPQYLLCRLLFRLYQFAFRLPLPDIWLLLRRLHAYGLLGRHRRGPQPKWFPITGHRLEQLAERPHRNQPQRHQTHCPHRPNAIAP